MDGYAVRAEDTLGASNRSAVALTVVGTVAMGETTRLRVTREPPQISRRAE
jgi:molybdopterin biosynthesis enzyme